MFRKRNARGGSNSRQSIGSSLNHRSSNATNKPSRPRGLFVDRIWHCDCDARLPAEHFRVKKEGPNKGRWFYTCQKAQDERCGFFLWDEDAEPRMQAALLHGGGTETDAPAGSVARAPPMPVPANQQKPQAEVSPPPPYTAASAQAGPTAQARPSRKRTLPWAQENSGSETADEDETLPWPATAEEHSLATTTDSLPPSTPRKAIKTSAFATPGSHLRTENGLTTPQTSTTAETGHSRIAPHLSDQDAQTPTPSRFHDATTSAPITPSKPGSELTGTVLSFLTSSRINLPKDNLAGLRAILETHDQQVKGILKGRDVAREAVKMKDARIAELVGRVEALEGDLELYRARVRTLKTETQASTPGGREEAEL